MNVNIDFGNIWEMMSAIGTVGAVIISLFLTWRASKKNSEPIQGAKMYSQHVYMGISKGELIEVVSKEEAIAIKYEGRMRFYNPSDEPKSLTNLNIAVTYAYNEENLIIPIPILKDEKEYISLSPKATRIIDYETHQSINDFSNEQIEFFSNVKDYVLQGTNEDMESQVYKLTV